MNDTSILRHVLLLVLLGLAAPAHAAQESEAPARFARIASDDAVVRNLADEKGIAILEPRAGTLVAVYRELAGWLEVEVPGGYVAWVHGDYLRPTDTPGISEVTNNAVNVRPLPKSTVDSFPLPQRLHAGDRLRVLPLGADDQPDDPKWVKIQTPPGVHAWIRTTAVADLSAGEDGKALWREALARAAEARPVEAAAPRPAAAEASAGASALEGTSARADAEALALVERAQALLAKDPERVGLDYAAVLALLDEADALSSSGDVQLRAQGLRERALAYQKIDEVRAELESARDQRVAELEAKQREVLEASRRKDPLGAAFLVRGTLVRNVLPDGSPRYFVTFGGETLSELLCTSGRYDLDLFAGYEVGVQGTELQSASGTREVPAVETERLEVLRRR